MIEGITLSLIIRITSAIILLWGASFAMRRYGLFWPFLPLIVYFIGITGTASAEFYEIFVTNLQVLFDALFLVFYIWMLVVIVLLIRKSL